MISVAIDGPSGAGKSTLAKRLAKELGYIYVDTGAMYRSIGLFGLREKADLQDAAAMQQLLPRIHLELASIDGAQHIYLNGEDVSETIRQEQVGMAASAVAAHPCVREFLLGLQRGMAEKQNVLMDGRDIGTVILPKATVKIFLTASDEDRAMRRTKELRAKGMDVRYEDVLREMLERDENDRTRAVAPAVAAPDAIHFDNSGMQVEECTAAILELIRAHRPEEAQR